MFGKMITLSAVAALAAATMVPDAAEARSRHDRGWSEGRGYNDGGRHYRGDRGRYYGNRGYNGRGYNNGGYYGRGYSNGYGRGGRCRDSGTGGTIIGAIAGGLLGNEVASNGRYGRRGDGTTGAILGAGIGALAGRAIDRNC